MDCTPSTDTFLEKWYNVITGEERRKVVIGINRRQYTKEQKEELVQALLSGQTALGLPRNSRVCWPRMPLPKVRKLRLYLSNLRGALQF